MKDLCYPNEVVMFFWIGMMQQMNDTANQKRPENTKKDLKIQKET